MNNNKLETILLNWKFSKNIIEKYKSIGINEIFDWQAECLNLNTVLSNSMILKFTNLIINDNNFIY